MGIKYDTDTIKLINLFEKVSDVKVKDCLVNENIIFIVNKGYMGKARLRLLNLVMMFVSSLRIFLHL